MPLVSVLMPVYNREKLIGDAIYSILNQTFKDWELIILDDCSTDRTLEVCREFAKADSRIRVFSNQKNVGVGPTRNMLTGYAKGKYIANHDSDDISVPERLAHEVQLLESRPDVGLVSGIAAWLDDEGKVFMHFPSILENGGQYPQSQKEMARLLYLGCIVVNPGCMFRKELIHEINDPYGNYRIVDDWHFLLQVAHRTLIWGLQEVVVFMRRGKNHSHLWETTLSAQKEALRLSRYAYQQFKNNPDSPINYWLYRKSIAPFLTQQGRILCGWKGYWNILQAVSCDPTYKRGWESLWEFSGRAVQKLKRVTFGKIST